MYDPLTSLKAKEPDLAGRVGKLISELEKRKAQDSAKRLAVVAQKFSDFTVEGAYQYIKKDEIILELEERGVWWLSVLFIIRDLLSIAPIAFTWWALHWAASAYQRISKIRIIRWRTSINHFFFSGKKTFTAIMVL